MTDRKTMREAMARFAETARALDNQCRNNEFQTRVSLVNPFLELLGYNSRDPDVVKMEYTADIGKAGEKVDYAIFREGDPYIFIEVKSTDKNIRDAQFGHQLSRYFLSEEKVRFAALTNGIRWCWYRREAISSNMEKRPFMTHDVSQPDDLVVEWLWSVSGYQQDSRQAERQAQSAFVRQSIMDWIEAVRDRPGDDFVRFLAREADLGTVRKKNLETMRTDVRFALNGYIEGEIDRVLETAGRRAEREPGTTDDRGGSDVGVGTAVGGERPEGFAWRVRGGDWRPAKNGVELQIAVAWHLASLDRRGPEGFYRFARTARGKSCFLGSQLDARRPDVEHPERYRAIDTPTERYWIEVHMSAAQRRAVLDRLCGEVETRDGSPIRFGEEIELRMPGL